MAPGSCRSRAGRTGPTGRRRPGPPRPGGKPSGAEPVSFFALPDLGQGQQEDDRQRHRADGELGQRDIGRLEGQEQHSQQHAVDAQHEYLVDVPAGEHHSGGACRDQDQEGDLQGIHEPDGDGVRGGDGQGHCSFSPRWRLGAAARPPVALVPDPDGADRGVRQVRPGDDHERHGHKRLAGVLVQAGLDEHGRSDQRRSDQRRRGDVVQLLVCVAHDQHAHRGAGHDQH